MSDAEFENYWAEQRKKNAHLIGTVDLEKLARERAEDVNSAFNKRFPVWTYEELAFLQNDRSILLVANSNSTAHSPGTHGTRTYKPENENYQKVFEKHRFNERTDDYHWIVENHGKVIGEGWGSEIA